MIDPKNISFIPLSELRTPSTLASLKTEILSPRNEDRRDEVLLALGERLLAESMLEDAAEVGRSIVGWLPEKATFLASVASKCHKSGQVDRSDTLFRESVAMIRHCPTLWQQAETLVAVAEEFHGVGATPRALELVERAERLARKEEREAGVQDSLDASGVLARVACTYVLLGQKDEGLKIVKQIKSAPHRRSGIRMVKSMIHRSKDS